MDGDRPIKGVDMASVELDVVVAVNVEVTVIVRRLETAD
jgi:hypothetical protein